MHRPFRYAPPPPGPRAFVRARLSEVLGRRWSLRLVTVEAGAGFGKTTLLAQALAEGAAGPAGRDIWLSCEPSDGSPSHLFAGLLTAMGEPPREHELASLDAVCAALWRLAPERACLVLDDAHLVDPASAGARALAELVERLPANAGLVVAGRALPALGRSRLGLAGQGVHLGEDDLRFDPVEAERLVRLHGYAHGQASDRGAGAGAAAAQAPLAGWPALTELAAAAGAGVATTAEARAAIERYLHEEVLSALADADRRGLAYAVALGGADRDLLEAVTGGPVDLPALGRVPLVHADGSGGLRPHHLWADLLVDRLRQPDVADARRRGAAVMAARGEFGPAFELLALAGDWDGALDVVVEACNDQRRPPWADVMARWRASIPAALHDRPGFAYLDAMVERAHDPWSDRCDHAFRHAIAAFRAAGQGQRAMAGGVRASFVHWARADRGAVDADYAECEALVARGLPFEGVAHLNRAVRADIDGDVGAMRAHAGAIDVIEARLAHFPGFFRAVAALLAGDAAEALGPAAEAAAAAAGVFPAAGTGWAGLLPAVARWAAGEVVAPGDPALADRGPRLAAYERAPALAVAAIVAAHHDDAERAAQALAALDAVASGSVRNRPLMAGFRAVAAATVAAAAGDEARAHAALADGLDGVALEPSGAGRAVVWFPAVPYLYHDRARAWLDALAPGTSRARVLQACRALLSGRAGGPLPGVALLDDPDALVTALPPRLALELAVRADAAGRQAHDAVRALCERAPSAARATFASLAAGPPPALQRATAGLRAAVAIPPRYVLTLDVLGPMVLRRDGAVVGDKDWQRERVRQMLGVLVAHRAVRRQRVGALLWPDHDEDSVSQNLRMTLSYLQGVLEPGRARGEAAWFLRQHAGVLELRDDATFTVDAWQADRHLDAAARCAREGLVADELDHLCSAVAAWRGELLDGIDDEWVLPVRRRLTDRLAAAAIRAGDLLAAGGRATEARALADRLLAHDPWSEAGMRIAAAAQAAAGDPAGARRLMRQCLEALAELGVDPDPRSWALAARLGLGGQRPAPR